MSMTVTQFKSELLRRYPTRDWNQQCAALVWNTVSITTGLPDSRLSVYPSAIVGAKASTIVPRPSSESVAAYVGRAPIGAVHHWSYGSYGHDGVSLGGGMMLHTSVNATNTEKWAGHVFVAAVLSYRLGTYLGWSLTYGRNPAIMLVADAPKPYQRIVGSGGVSQRAEPSSQSLKRGFFPPGERVSLLGWRKGESVAGVDTWFKFDEGKWCWAGGFTDKSVAGLVDLTLPEPEPAPIPEPTPEPPVVEPEPDPPVVEPVEPPAKKTPPLWVILSGGIVTFAIAVASVLKSLAII